MENVGEAEVDDDDDDELVDSDRLDPVLTEELKLPSSNSNQYLTEKQWDCCRFKSTAAAAATDQLMDTARTRTVTTLEIFFTDLTQLFFAQKIGKFQDINTNHMLGLF